MVVPKALYGRLMASKYRLGKSILFTMLALHTRGHNLCRIGSDTKIIAGGWFLLERVS